MEALYKVSLSATRLLSWCGISSGECLVWMAPALQGLTRCFLRFGRVQSCVRPFDAVVQDRWP
jgi:hypothetical protein